MAWMTLVTFNSFPAPNRIAMSAQAAREVHWGKCVVGRCIRLTTIECFSITRKFVGFDAKLTLYGMYGVGLGPSCVVKIG